MYSDEDGHIDIDLLDEFDKTANVSADLISKLDAYVVNDLITPVEDYIAHKTGVGKAM